MGTLMAKASTLTKWLRGFDPRRLHKIKKPPQWTALLWQLRHPPDFDR
jgi:hypothetical protein